MSINSVNSNQNTVTQTNKNGAIVGASTLGAGAGLGAGYFGAMKVADEFIKQNGKIIDNPKLVDNYIDDLGDLVADFAQGKSIKEGTTEAHIFFNTKLRPRDTVAIEDFIKKNNWSKR